MKILLSSIGSRGDVQPILALACQLQHLGHQTRLCVPPNFKNWIESFGVECVPIGPDLQKLTGGSVSGIPKLPSAEQLHQMAVQTVKNQFEVIGQAVQGCHMIVAAGALQIAARSLAEANHIPYIFAAYCPAVIPSSHYPPPKTGGFYQENYSPEENLRLWQDNAKDFDQQFLATLNEARHSYGLEAVASVRDYMMTRHPWLAADKTLAPVITDYVEKVEQTGAWLMPPGPALPAELDRFLSAGDAPVYLGFGSMRASDQTGKILIEAVQKLGRRALLSQGWANMIPPDQASDVFSVGDVSHALLFPHVAAVVHHGGAGTTTTAALAGVPQVIIPHNYDQLYWGQRIDALGAGCYGPFSHELTSDALANHLEQILSPQVSSDAMALSRKIDPHGADHAAEQITSQLMEMK
ncbi:MAG TPA: glycosyltransferase [Bellilinea sp.]|nr:glycosyltransferase [Bellilinea sp.]